MSVGLYLWWSIVGKDKRFIVIMVVFIILVDVVRRVFMRVIDKLSLFCIGLNKWFMEVSSFLVILECLSMMFININRGIVMSVVFVMVLKMCWGRGCM